MNYVLPLKVHAVKLAYRKRLLETMPNGYFCLRKGRPAVAVTFDPQDLRCTRHKPRVLLVSSKQGQVYAGKIKTYLDVKHEYDVLLNKWNQLYTFPPPRVNLPLRQPFEHHKMNNEFFNGRNDNLGKYKSDNPTVSEDGVFKSKNELMAADALKQLGIPFKYETELYIDEAEEWINPDFLVDFFEIDRCCYLEVLGMNDKFSYAAGTSTKITSYSKGKYRPGREVIYVHMYDKHNFDKTYFIEQVLSAFNTLIPDNALEWGKDINEMSFQVPEGRSYSA